MSTNAPATIPFTTRYGGVSRLSDNNNGFSFCQCESAQAIPRSERSNWFNDGLTVSWSHWHSKTDELLTGLKLGMMEQCIMSAGKIKNRWAAFGYGIVSGLCVYDMTVLIMNAFANPAFLMELAIVALLYALLIYNVKNQKIIFYIILYSIVLIPHFVCWLVDNCRNQNRFNSDGNYGFSGHLYSPSISQHQINEWVKVCAKQQPALFSEMNKNKDAVGNFAKWLKNDVDIVNQFSAMIYQITQSKNTNCLSADQKKYLWQALTTIMLVILAKRYKSNNTNADDAKALIKDSCQIMLESLDEKQFLKHNLFSSTNIKKFKITESGLLCEGSIQFVISQLMVQLLLNNGVGQSLPQDVLELIAAFVWGEAATRLKPHKSLSAVAVPPLNAAPNSNSGTRILEGLYWFIVLVFWPLLWPLSYFEATCPTFCETIKDKYDLDYDY